MTDFELLFSLFAAFQIKHFLCDFPLQREFMIAKKGSENWDFFIPLLIHSSVHAFFSLAIILVVNSNLWWLAIVDLIVHFIMDRIKSGRRYLGRFQDTTKAVYWNIFGFDQMVHHFTHYTIIWFLVHHGL
ncbi:MAG: DUF3307 domain-containing protein [Bdellovibrionales bacterium]|nr:DUF3307 domain-containing protein [Bdellovibrionales bacterium]